MGPPRSGSSGGVVVVVVVVLLLVFGGIGGLILLGGDDDSDDGDTVSADDTDSTDGDASDLDLDLPEDDSSSDIPETAPTTAYEPEPLPAEAAVHDCISIDSGGTFMGTGSCNVGGTPYKVVEVVDYVATCSNASNYYITSGDYLLCLELNILYNYCYVFPEGTGWIQASECELPGTVHVIDVVIGGVDGDECTTDYVWDFWYGFDNPPMVVCVDEY